MTQKQQACDNAKSEYGAELQKTNDYQREHFGKLIPEIIQVICVDDLSAMLMPTL